MEKTYFSEEKAIAATQAFKERKYWSDKLSGNFVKSIFPYDYARGRGNNGHMETVKCKFSGELFKRLLVLCNGSDFRLHVIFVAVLTLLIDKYTNSKDIIVGVPIEKQNEEADFVNTVLVLRNQVEDFMTFKELLLDVRATVLEANENQNYPIEMLLNDLNLKPEEDENEFPLFDISILLENIHDKRYIQHVNPSVIFSFLRTESSIESVLEYNSLLYEKVTVERIMSHYANLLEKSIFNVDLQLSDFHLLSEEERKQLLYDFNNTDAEYPNNKTIHELFEAQVDKTPDNTAVIGTFHVMPDKKTVAVTYRELNERANQLARLLKNKGVKQDTIVVICVDRSIDMLIGIFGILKAGGAYLPVDPYSAQNRTQFILNDSGAEQIVTTKHITGKKEFKEKLIFIDDPGIYLGDNSNPGYEIHVENLAYVIYTSGTTGHPKGVLVEHRGVVNYVWWTAKKYVKNEKINFPLYTSFSFDLTVTSIFTPLITGNAVVVYQGDKNAFLIEKVINEDKVEVIKLTPSHLKLVRNKQIQDSSFSRDGIKSKVKRLILGGEELGTSLARDIYTNFNGNIEMYNEYGPTETVVGSMIYKFNPLENTRKFVSIGVPIDNTQIYLLDRNQMPVSPGAVGEIYVSGIGVARGYLNRVQLTSEKFITNPFAEDARMYRTGDLARWLSDGNLEFLGRIDQQINIGGFRVEIGEIESQLSNHKDIKEAVVIARKDENGNKYLCAYLITLEELNISEIREYLLLNLASYMIPSYFVRLDQVPLTPNGKLDVRKLPKPDGSMKTGTEYIAPRNEIEKKLASIWSKELELEKIGAMDKFFNIGGDSIKSIRLINLINKEFNTQFKIVDLYQNETLEKFANLIGKNGSNISTMEFKEISSEMEDLKNQFLEGI